MTPYTTPTHQPDGSPSTNARTLLRDANSALHAGRFALVEPGSFVTAIVDAEGGVRWADGDFAEVVGEAAASVDCRRLIERAQRSGRATGLATSTSRGPVVMQVRAASADANWPLPPEGLAALVAGTVLMVAFAPSRSANLARATAESLGLAPREADLAAALLEAPSLQLAATQAGMSRETAKDTLKRACRRVGARNAADLVSRLLDVACGDGVIDEAAIGAPLGLTPAEARVAAATARGQSVADAARALDLTEATVKSHRKAIYAKTGVTRDRDLRRLLAETSRALSWRRPTKSSVMIAACGAAAADRSAGWSPRGLY